MASLTTISLRDGSQVPKPTYFTVRQNLYRIRDESTHALWELVQKCKNPKYQFFPQPLGFPDNPLEILKKHELIDSRTEKVHEDIRKIVLHSVKDMGPLVQLIESDDD